MFVILIPAITRQLCTRCCANTGCTYIILESNIQFKKLVQISNIPQIKIKWLQIILKSDNEQYINKYY